MEPLAAKPKGRGRQFLPETLGRRAVYDLGNEKQKRPQRQEVLRRIGEEVSERLEYVPASLVGAD